MPGSPDAVDGAQRSGAIVWVRSYDVGREKTEIGGREVEGCFRDGGGLRVLVEVSEIR